jgi:uncharacterized membrane protein
MEISKLFDLPAHPLLVHVPIVLIPLVTIAAVVLAVRPATRRHLGPVAVGLAAVGAIGVQLALGSGEALQPHVEKTALLRRHTELADSLRPLILLFFVLLVIVVVLDRRRPRARTWLLPMVSVLAVVSGLVTTARLVQVGDAGARATWHDTNMSRRATPNH